tara:strand:- start:531 stop:2189 length:1659 start_codon:yes stop_codon:yes gene_type:complete
MLFLPLLLSFNSNKVDLPLKSPFEIKQNENSKKDFQDIDSKGSKNKESINIDPNIINWLPKIQGEIPYSFEQIKILLNTCKGQSLEETLNSCAAKLTAELVNDGYSNSRVYTLLEGKNGTLDVIMGRIYELKIRSDNEAIKQKVYIILEELKDQILHQPTLQKKIAEAKEIKNIGQISGDISRLGSDPTKAILKINATYNPSDWQRQLNVRNDGSSGTGQWRSIGSFVKTDIFKKNDMYIGMIEINTDQQAEVGSQLYSSTYVFPISKKLNLTNSFAYSRSDMVEFEGDLRTLRFDSLQFNFQLDRSLINNEFKTLSSFASFSNGRTESFFGGILTPLVTGANTEGWVRGGHIKAGLNFTKTDQKKFFSGSIYGQQGLSFLSKDIQLEDFELNGIFPGQSKALGSNINFSWTINPRFGINLSSSAQLALNPLTSGMSFSLGGSSGLKGLTSSVTGGDSGWQQTIEGVITTYQKEGKAFQVVPYIGYGEVNTKVNGITTDDSAGSAGILFRAINSNQIYELGFYKFINTKDNAGTWNDWLLGNGIFSSISINF